MNEFPLFIGINPGGVRALAPAIRHFKKAYVVSDSRSTRYFPNDITVTETIPSNFSSGAIRQFLSKLRPSIIVTGTSLPESIGGNLENLFRQVAKELGIPSLGILDHWCNYSQRFSSRSGTLLDSVPDMICVMDERARNEMLKEGFPEDKLMITGQPAFDTLLRDIVPQLPQLRQEARKRMGILPGTRLIGFVSEPIHKDHGRLRPYNELDTLSDLMRLCSGLARPSEIVIKHHPRDKRDKFRELMQKHSLAPCREWPTDDATSFIAACDVIVGMTSVLLIQALLIGKTVVSYQPNTKIKDASAQVIRPVQLLTSANELTRYFQDDCDDEPELNGVNDKFYQKMDATDEVVRTINHYLATDVPYEEEHATPIQS